MMKNCDGENQDWLPFRYRLPVDVADACRLDLELFRVAWRNTANVLKNIILISILSNE